MKAQPHERVRTVFTCAQQARRTLTPAEVRFSQEGRRRWPTVSWRRYHPITIRAFEDCGPSTWYAPFLNIHRKVIVILEHRDDFPYRIYGRNYGLYAQQGYTVLDFSEDFFWPVHIEPSTWEQAMDIIGKALR